MRTVVDIEPAVSPISIRELGEGETVLLHLHGGWGYTIYPLDWSLPGLIKRFRVLIPDRAGYGHSGRRRGPLPLDFHRRAADETLAVMDALDISRAVIWGHSDGACTAAWMGIEAPQRCQALILEALHFDRHKAGSIDFFATMEHDPARLGDRVAALLAAEHGDEYWQLLLRWGGRVWRELREARLPHPDLFGGRLGELVPPTLLLHGARDPRTEPAELAAIQAVLPTARLALIAAGGHCPHSELDAWQESLSSVLAFLNDLDDSATPAETALADS